MHLGTSSKQERPPKPTFHPYFFFSFVYWNRPTSLCDLERRESQVLTAAGGTSQTPATDDHSSLIVTTNSPILTGARGRHRRRRRCHSTTCWCALWLGILAMVTLPDVASINSPFFLRSMKLISGIGSTSGSSTARSLRTSPSSIFAPSSSDRLLFEGLLRTGSSSAGRLLRFLEPSALSATLLISSSPSSEGR